jgi:PEP-CTERM motif
VILPIGLFATMLQGAGMAEAGFGVNLITNPGAEAGVLVSNIGGFNIYSTPGWTNVEGAFEAETYAQGAGTISPASPGPPDRGALLFYGGDAAVTVATQLIDVTSEAAGIATGKVVANLSGWLGGFDSQNDAATLSVTFLGSGSVLLDTESIGPVTAADRGDVSGLLYRSTVEFVPEGTTSIEVTLTMNRTDGLFNNGAADNLNLSLTAVPEPSSLLMLGLGVAGVAVFRLRSK